MVPRMFSCLARVRVTVGYAIVLIAVATILGRLDPAAQDRVIRHASTNLHNLGRGHVGTLLGSAVVVDAGPVLYWLPGLVCLLALGELLWRSGRLVVAFGVGHVGATLLVAAGLTAAVTHGWLSPSVTRATDVGMSYGATAVLGAITAAIPRRWRPIWIGWWLAAAVAVVAVEADFTDVGHLLSLVLGMMAATRFGVPRPWTPAMLVLLGVAAPYGFLVLANGEGTPVPAAAWGVAGAVLGAVLTGLVGWARAGLQRNRTADDSIQSECQDSGGSSSSSPAA